MEDLFFNSGFIFCICYLATVIGKCIVAAIISNCKNMSNEKAKFITKMMSKDININFH